MYFNMDGNFVSKAGDGRYRKVKVLELDYGIILCPPVN